jgi:hypothetical protein
MLDCTFCCCYWPLLGEDLANTPGYFADSLYQDVLSPWVEATLDFIICLQGWRQSLIYYSSPRMEAILDFVILSPRMEAILVSHLILILCLLFGCLCSVDCQSMGRAVVFTVILTSVVPHFDVVFGFIA